MKTYELTLTETGEKRYIAAESPELSIRAIGGCGRPTKVTSIVQETTIDLWNTDTGITAREMSEEEVNELHPSKIKKQ